MIMFEYFAKNAFSFHAAILPHFLKSRCWAMFAFFAKKSLCERARFNRSKKVSFVLLYKNSITLCKTVMPMCSPDCNCRWCHLTEMAAHAGFRDRVDALLAEYASTVPPKPRLQCPPEGHVQIFREKCMSSCARIITGVVGECWASLPAHVIAKR